MRSPSTTRTGSAVGVVGSGTLHLSQTVVPGQDAALDELEQQAQGEADAKVLQATAEAEAITRVSEAIAKSKTDPATYMLLMKYVDSLKEIASGDKTKTVFLPFEASNLVGALGSLTELIDKKK